MEVPSINASKQAECARAERRVLGSMLIDPSCVPKILNKLSPADFSVRQNREIFRSIRLLNRRAAPADAVTVLHKLWEMGCWDELSYHSYICQMMSETPSPEEVDRHIAQMLSPEIPSCDYSGEERVSRPDSEEPPPYPSALKGR